jgi:hypothetical protein
MSSMPVSSNSLHLENPLRGYGFAHLILAGGILVLALLRLVVSPLSDRLAPLELLWIGLVPVAVAVLGHGFVGLRALVSFTVQAGAPALIHKAAHAVPQLLLHRTISDTYERPVKFLEQLIFHFLPQYIYLTPANRRVLTGIRGLLLTLLAGGVALVFLGPAGTWLLVPPLLALVARAAALHASTPEIPRCEDVCEQAHHLTRAGDPIGLFHHTRMVLETFREKDFQNRVLLSQLPQVGANAASNRTEADLAIETQPLPLAPPRGPRNAQIMDLAGVVLGLLAWGLFLSLWGVPYADPRVWVAGFLAAGLALLCALGCFRIAFGLHNTFRFRSDLYWLSFEGSYHVLKLGPTGGHGTLSAVRDCFQSDLRLFARGVRVVTECTAPYGSMRSWEKGAGLAGDLALRTPRYVVATDPDREFRGRLGYLIQELDAYRDEGGKLRAPDLDENLANLIAMNAQIQQLQAQAQGQALAQLHQGLPPLVLPVQAAPLGLPGPQRPSLSIPQPASPPTTPVPTAILPPGPPSALGTSTARAASAGNTCPKCGKKVATGSRYCLLCDLNF